MTTWLRCSAGLVRDYLRGQGVSRELWCAWRLSHLEEDRSVVVKRLCVLTRLSSSMRRSVMNLLMAQQIEGGMHMQEWQYNTIETVHQTFPSISVIWSRSPRNCQICKNVLNVGEFFLLLPLSNIDNLTLLTCWTDRKSTLCSALQVIAPAGIIKNGITWGYLCCWSS